MAKKPSDKDLIKAACAEHEGESPDTLLVARVEVDRIVIVLSDHRKFTYSLGDLVKKHLGQAPSKPENMLNK